MGILSKVSQREKLGPLPEELALRVAQASERNLRRALLMLEACHVQQPTWSAEQEVCACVRGVCVCGIGGRAIIARCRPASPLHEPILPSGHTQQYY